MSFIGKRDDSRNYVVPGWVLNAIEDFMTNLSFEGRRGRPNGPSVDLTQGPFKGRTVIAVPRAEMPDTATAYRTTETDESYPVNMYCCDIYIHSFSGQPELTDQPLESATGPLQLNSPVTAVPMVSEDADGKPMRKYMVSGSGGGEGAVPAKITGVASGVYTVDLYANGKDEDSTGTGEMEILNLNIDESLPVDTWVMAHPRQVTLTGSEE